MWVSLAIESLPSQCQGRTSGASTSSRLVLPSRRSIAASSGSHRGAGAAQVTIAAVGDSRRACSSSVLGRSSGQHTRIAGRLPAVEQSGPGQHLGPRRSPPRSPPAAAMRRRMTVDAGSASRLSARRPASRREFMSKASSTYSRGVVARDSPGRRGWRNGPFGQAGGDDLDAGAAAAGRRWSRLRAPSKPGERDQHGVACDLQEERGDRIPTTDGRRRERWAAITSLHAAGVSTALEKIGVAVSSKSCSTSGRRHPCRSPLAGACWPLGLARWPPGRTRAASRALDRSSDLTSASSMSGLMPSRPWMRRVGRESSAQS